MKEAAEEAGVPEGPEEQGASDAAGGAAPGAEEVVVQESLLLT